MLTTQKFLVAPDSYLYNAHKNTKNLSLRASEIAISVDVKSADQEAAAYAEKLLGAD